MRGKGGWHAHASSLELTDFILLGLDQVCQFVQAGSPLLGTELAPWAFVCSSGGGDCSIDICNIGDWDVLLIVEPSKDVELETRRLLTATCLPVAGL